MRLSRGALSAAGRLVLGLARGVDDEPQGIALVEVEDALAPAFLVEDLPDGKCTVFLPSAPTPAAGTIYIIDRARVHPIDVPITTAFKCVTRWGTGAGELLAAMRPRAA